MGTLVRKLHLTHRTSLDKMIGELMSMISKVTTQDDDQVKQFKPKYIKVKGEGRQEISTIAAMVREIVKIDIGQIVEIGEYYSVVECNMDRIIDTDHRCNQNYRGDFRRENLRGIM